MLIERDLDRIVFGCGNFGGMGSSPRLRHAGDSEEQGLQLLDYALRIGLRRFDTANTYGGGASEIILGKWLRAQGASFRQDAQIATKVGNPHGCPPGDTPLSRTQIAHHLDRSLERLGIERIDLYYQHKDDESVPLADSLGAFDQLRQAGKIHAIGLSNFTAPRVEEALALSIEHRFEKPAALQNWYNLVERGKFEGELQSVALDRGLAVFSYYSLANGFLTGKYRSKDDLTKSPRGLRNIEYLESDRGRRVLAALEEVSAETGAAMATVALAWLKAQPGITAPIASATSAKQAEELVAALNLDLTAGQIEQLDEASA